MFKEILLPLLVIGLSELGDKTQLAIFCLSAKTNKKINLLFGVLSAFLITSLIAAFFGEIISEFIPHIYLAIGSGSILILFGILFFTKKEEDKVTCTLKNPILSGFSLILISEIGDKSQISTALFSANMTPIFVFIGAFLALATLSIFAVYLGSIIAKKINHEKLSIFSGIIFVSLGIAAIINELFF